MLFLCDQFAFLEPNGFIEYIINYSYNIVSLGSCCNSGTFYRLELDPKNRCFFVCMGNFEFYLIRNNRISSR